MKINFHNIIGWIRLQQSLTDGLSGCHHIKDTRSRFYWTRGRNTVFNQICLE